MTEVSQLGPRVETDGRRAGDPDRFVKRGLANRRQRRYLVRRHRVLSLDKLTRREARGLQSSVSDQQVDHKHDQQNTADADAAAISPPGIAETTPEE